ncbi:MAG: FixH family protein [Acidobacteriota bacterium]|nr:MAG: FixH family protein [Acidobacteriota bacterium]
MRTKGLVASFVLVSLGVIAAGCGAGGSSPVMTTIAEKKVGENLAVAISNPEGKLKNGEQEIGLKFTDGSGNPVEISAASLNFNMPAMGSMAEMNDPATLNTTSTPGEFAGKVKLQMAGEWIAQISYEGEETGKTTMEVTAY